MKFTSTGKYFTVDGQTVWYTFNLLEVETHITGYFIPFDDDHYAIAITPVTIYFEYLPEAMAWIYISGFHVPEELLQQMKASLPSYSKKLFIQIANPN
jgi:hypothetical protein